MKKILFLTDGIAPFVVGGMQKHSSGLIVALAKEGFDITVMHCVKEGVNRPSSDQVKETLGIADCNNVEFRCFYFPNAGSLPGHYVRASYMYSKKLFEAVEKDLESFDFIYAKGFTPWHFLALKARGKIKLPPIGVKFHGYEMFQHGGNWKQRLQKYMLKGPTQWINKHADYVFSYGGKISEIIKSLGVKESNIIEIPTAIDAEWIRKDKKQWEGLRRFLFIGRFERRKGIEELQQVIEEGEFPSDVEFHFVGPIPASKKLKRDSVIYHGEVKDRAELLKIIDNCHVLVCPSHAEGMPNVILEAMARGLAVIASDVGAVRALIQGTDGMLIEPQSKENLKDALRSFINLDVEALKQCEEKAKTKVLQNFTWEIIGKESKNQLNRLV